MNYCAKTTLIVNTQVLLWPTNNKLYQPMEHWQRSKPWDRFFQCSPFTIPDAVHHSQKGTDSCTCSRSAKGSRKPQTLGLCRSTQSIFDSFERLWRILAEVTVLRLATLIITRLFMTACLNWAEFIKKARRIRNSEITYKEKSAQILSFVGEWISS